MPKHLSTRQVSELIARQLAPGDLSAAMQHLAQCDACRAQVYAADNTEKRFAALHARFKAETVNTEHLDYDQISRFVDQSLTTNERAAVKNHLESCDDCAVQVRELETLWTAIQASPISPIIRMQQKKAFWFRRPVVLRYSLAAAAIALVALIVTVSWLRPTAELQPNQTASKVSTASPSPNNAILVPTPPATTSETGLALTDHGQRIALDSQGNLIGLTELPAAYQQIVKAAIANQRAPVSPTVAELASSKGTLLGQGDNNESFNPISPVGKVLLADRPAFRWQKVAGADKATSYSVVVLDQKLNVVASGETIGVTSWTPPDSLPRDQVLRWQVTARIGEKQIISPAPPMPEARFKILPQAKAAELTRAAKNYSNSHLLLGSLYSEAGLMEEAEREFRSLLTEYADSPIARSLLRGVQSQKRIGQLQKR